MSGLSRTPGKRVRVNSPPRVRIPPAPPGTLISCGLRAVFHSTPPITSHCGMGSGPLAFQTRLGRAVWPPRVCAPASPENLVANYELSVWPPPVCAPASPINCIDTTKASVWPPRVWAGLPRARGDHPAYSVLQNSAEQRGLPSARGDHVEQSIRLSEYFAPASHARGGITPPACTAAQSPGWRS